MRNGWPAAHTLVTALCLVFASAPSVRADDSDYATTLPEDSTTPPAPAPYQPPLRFELQLAGALALPWHSSEGSVGLGFGLFYGVGWGDLPLLLGLDFMSFDGATRAKTQVDIWSDGQHYVGIKTARDRVLCFDLWVRVQPPFWPVRPYLEGFVGEKLLQTSYTFDFGTDNTMNDYAKDHDWTSSLGWGAGIDVPGLLSRDGQISLTLGFRRLKGARAQLARSVQLNGATSVATHSVATDETILMLGVGGRASL
jgi:hypothetical protein